MNGKSAPLLLPGAAFACGASLAFHLQFLPVFLLSLLALLGFALRRSAGTALAFLALGLLAAAVRLGLPESPVAGIDRERPVEAVVRVSGHWIPDDDGWSAPARVLRVRQSSRVVTPSLEVRIHLPDPETAPPPFGTSLRAKGFITRSAGFANRVPVPPAPWRLRVKSRSLMQVEEEPGWIARLSGALRRRVEEAYAAAGPASEGERQGKALARALVLGDASGLPLEWKRGLRLTGTYHLMSVSGVHVALAAGVVWLLGGWLPRSLRLLLMLAAISLYLLLVGPLPALVRAAVMGLLAVLALLAERPPSAANALGWAIVLLVLEDPAVVLSPAFQLTVTATAGLLLLAPPLAERWRGVLPSWLAESLAASVGAQLATLPWALPRFHLLCPLAPLLNLAAVPWTGLALVAALLWTALALVSPDLAARFLPALDVLAAPFSWPSRTRPEVWLPLPLVAPPLLAWLLAGATAAVLFLRWRRALAVLAAGTAVLGACSLVDRERVNHREPEVVMLDVGQGDSILLRDRETAVLVDGGGWERGDLGGRVLLPALLAEGVRDLAALVMTHPDRDHCRGLVDIAAYLPVREVWMGPGWEPEGCAGRLLALPGVRPRLLWAGETAGAGRWRLTALHPERGESRGTNERSLVLLAEANGRRVLLTGDIESWAEMRLLSCCERSLRVDVLKVAHHGSRTSSTGSFLAAARPRLALISAGVNNLYHHPAPDVVERLQDHGARVLRTDRSGMVRVVLDADGPLRIEMPGAPR
jgi:competence protein ComEC